MTKIMSDSSSLDEDEEKLKAALAEDFIWKAADRNAVGCLETKKSIRPNFIPESRDNFGTTPEFKEHVAKHLSKMLDRSFEEVTINPELISSEGLEDDCGFRLFSNSEKRSPWKVDQPNLPKRKCPQHSSSSSSEDERLAAAAVSSTWVLEQQQIYMALDTKLKQHKDLSEKGENINNKPNEKCCINVNFHSNEKQKPVKDATIKHKKLKNGSTLPEKTYNIDKKFERSVKHQIESNSYHKSKKKLKHPYMEINEPMDFNQKTLEQKRNQVDEHCHVDGVNIVEDESHLVQFKKKKHTKSDNIKDNYLKN